MASPTISVLKYLKQTHHLPCQVDIKISRLFVDAPELIKAVQTHVNAVTETDKASQTVTISGKGRTVPFPHILDCP